MPRVLPLLACFCLGLESQAQSPSRSPAPPAASGTAPAATFGPTATPTAESLINTMGPADLQQAVQLLKGNYLNPDALNEEELNRAMLSGLLTRLGGGALLLPDRATENSEATNPFFGELLDGHVGYLRLGALTPGNLQATDAKLQEFNDKKADAIVIDLRASLASNDFASAAEFAKRFSPKGKLLFSLRKGAAKQERTFGSDRDPAFQGLMIVLIDGDTAGPAEAIAGVLRFYNKALLIGQPTAGRAVEFSDLPLNGGKFLRIAVAEAVLPENQPLFPGGLKPDVPVEMSGADKRAVFAQSLAGGMAPFIFETERPHLNEAALLAGRNPEIESAEPAQRRARAAEKPQVRDAVLQRAIDVVTSLSIYQHR